MQDSETFSYAHQPDATRTVIKFVALAVFLLVVMVFAGIFWPFVSVPAGHKGVATSFGQVQPGLIDEGLSIVAPWWQVTKISTQVLASHVEASAGTSDLQQLAVKITLNYHLVAGVLPQFYQKIGMGYIESVLQPATQEAVKAVTATYTAEALIKQREEVRAKIQAHLVKKLGEISTLKELPASGIAVDGMSITDFGFSHPFLTSIEQKQVAEQNALTEKNNADKAKWLAQQAVESARGQAAAFKAQSMELTDRMLSLEAIKKWDGSLPYYVGAGSNAIPFLSLAGSGNKPGGKGGPSKD